MASNATKSGNVLEAAVRKIVRDCKVTPYKQHDAGATGPLGESIKSDVLIGANSAFPLGLVIQCKKQDSQGSAHQKLFYLHETIKHHYTKPAVIVCDGVSSEIAAVYEWLKPRVGGMLLGVFWLKEFEEWFAEQTRKLNKHSW